MQLISYRLSQPPGAAAEPGDRPDRTLMPKWAQRGPRAITETRRPRSRTGWKGIDLS